MICTITETLLVTFGSHNDFVNFCFTIISSCGSLGECLCSHTWCFFMSVSLVSFGGLINWSVGLLTSWVGWLPSEFLNWMAVELTTQLLNWFYWLVHDCRQGEGGGAAVADMWTCQVHARTDRTVHHDGGVLHERNGTQGKQLQTVI